MQEFSKVALTVDVGRLSLILYFFLDGKKVGCLVACKQPAYLQPAYTLPSSRVSRIEYARSSTEWWASCGLRRRLDGRSVEARD